MARAKRNFSYRFTVDNAEKTKSDFEGIGNAAKSGLGKVPGAANAAAKGMDQASAAGKKFHTVTLSLENSSNTLTRTLKRLAGAAVFGQLTRNTIDTALGFEKVKIGLETALGSANAGGEAFKFVSEQVEKVGIPLLGTAESFTKLAAAARGTKLEGEPVRKLFIGMTEAAAVYRLSQEQVNGVFKAYTDSISKGFVQMEELKGQLGDRLPGVLRLAAQGLGLTTAELVKLVETGKLATEDFLPAFNKALQEDIAGGVEKASNSAQASFNRMNNAIQTLQNTFAENGFLDLTKEFVNVMTAFLQNDKVLYGAKILGEAFKGWAIILKGDFGKAASDMGRIAQLGEIIKKNTVDPSSFSSSLDTSFINFGESVFGQPKSSAKEIADYKNSQNKVLQDAFKEMTEIMKRQTAETNKLADEQGKAVGNYINTKPQVASKAADDLITSLREDAKIATSTGAVRSELEKQKRVKEIIAKLDKSMAQEQGGNLKETIVLTAQQRAEIEKLVGTMYKAEGAQKYQKDGAKALKTLNEEYAKLTPTVEDNIVEIQKWKDQTIAALLAAGVKYEEFGDKVEAVFDEKIKKATRDNLKDSSSILDGISDGLERIKEKQKSLAQDVSDAVVDMNDAISKSLDDLITTGKFNIQSLKDAAASALREIASGILKRGVVNPITDFAGGLLNSATSSLSSSAGSFLSGISLFHQGGEVGSTLAQTRNVPMGMFANAPRFHDGLFMRNDEFPAILQKGEQVIPRGQQAGGNTIVMNITTPNSQSFLQNKGQLTSSMYAEMVRQARRNG